jgi:hypothetical protein
MSSGAKHPWTFRAIIKKYPNKKPADVFKDLVASTPGKEGKWFAAAKSAGLYDEAIELADRIPCDPKTLTRSARNMAETEPRFAVEAGVAALRWLVEGYGYEITGVDVWAAHDYTMKAADDRMGTTREDNQTPFLQMDDQGLIIPNGVLLLYKDLLTGRVLALPQEYPRGFSPHVHAAGVSPPLGFPATGRNNCPSGSRSRAGQPVLVTQEFYSWVNLLAMNRPEEPKSRTSLSRLDQGHIDTKYAPFVRLTVHTNHAVMCLDNALDNSQAESRAYDKSCFFIFHSIEPVKNPT